jgi:hypothetical protein
MNAMDEMGITYRSMEEIRNAYKTLFGKPQGKGPLSR